MEKKIIFLELPHNIIEKIDEQNTQRSRSLFISNLIEKQLRNPDSNFQELHDATTTMHHEDTPSNQGKIHMASTNGAPLGSFDINTEEGFIQLAEKIVELSHNPIVQMKASNWK